MVKYARDPDNSVKAAKVGASCSRPAVLQPPSQTISKPTTAHTLPAHTRKRTLTRTRTHMQARGSDLRTHFKNTREAAFALRKMELGKAKKYLEAVLAHERVIIFRRFCGGIGRTPQAKNEGGHNGQGRWPKKSVEFLLGLLRNAESNAEVGARAGEGAMGLGSQRQHRRQQQAVWRC